MREHAALGCVASIWIAAGAGGAVDLVRLGVLLVQAAWLIDLVRLGMLRVQATPPMRWLLRRVALVELTGLGSLDSTLVGASSSWNRTRFLVLGMLVAVVRMQERGGIILCSFL